MILWGGSGQESGQQHMPAGIAGVPCLIEPRFVLTAANPYKGEDARETRMSTIPYRNTFKSVIAGYDRNQVECVENKQTLLRQERCPHSARSFEREKPFEGGAYTVPFRRAGEQSLKPSIFSRWSKRCVLLDPKAGARGFLNIQPDSSRDSV